MKFMVNRKIGFFGFALWGIVSFLFGLASTSAPWKLEGVIQVTCLLVLLAAFFVWGFFNGSISEAVKYRYKEDKKEQG